MTSRQRESIAHGERGNTLVEFGLASTVFFMTLFGILSLGVAVWQYNMVSDLAQEGARWAAVRGSTASTPATADSVSTYVTSRALGMTVTVATTWPDAGGTANQAGNRVQVTVTKSFTPMTAFVPRSALSLQSTAQMIIAR